jgi:hypothetical protein
MKNYTEITIKDYNTIERTGRISHLLAWYMPVFLFRNRVTQELKKLADILNSEKKDELKEDLLWKVQSLAKINAIEANFLGVLNMLHLGSRISSLKMFLSKRYRKRIKLASGNLQMYLENIKKYTCKDIANIDDIKKVRKDIQFRKDKFNENFMQKDKGDEKVYLMSVVLGIFSYLNQPINVDMPIVDFVVLRDEAYKRIEQEKAKK